MLGSKWGRLGCAGAGAVLCFLGRLNRLEGMHGKRKTFADQALAEVATDDRSDSGPMVQG